AQRLRLVMPPRRPDPRNHPTGQARNLGDPAACYSALQRSAHRAVADLPRAGRSGINADKIYGGSLKPVQQPLLVRRRRADLAQYHPVTVAEAAWARDRTTSPAGS